MQYKNVNVRLNTEQTKAVPELTDVKLIIVAQRANRGERLRTLLQRAGCEDISLGISHLPLSHGGQPRALNRRTLVIWLGEGIENANELQDMDRRCAAAKVAWLRAVFCSEHVQADVGPVFDSCCYMCFAAIHSISACALDIDNGQKLTPQIDLWLAVVVLRVLGYITAPAEDIPQVFMRYQLPDWQATKLYAPCLPSCNICAGVTEIIEPFRSDLLHEAVLFEQNLVLCTRGLLRGAKVDDQEASAATLTRRIRFSNSVSVPLRGAIQPQLGGDVHALLCESTLNGNVVFAKDHLGLLLQLTAGFRRRNLGDPRPQRWAASGGNLGSVEPFVLVRSLHGLASGLYFYQAAEHILIRIERKQENFVLEQMLHELLPFQPEVEVALLFTSAFARLRKKYSYFGYKLSQLDTGVAASQLSLVAQDIGLTSALSPIWPDDHIENICGLVEREEHVTGLMALSRSQSGSPTCPRPAVLEGAAGAVAPSVFAGMPLGDLYQRIYESSRLSFRDFSRRRMSSTFEPKRSVAVPRLSRPARSLPAVLSRRRSTRSFSSDLLDLEDLSTILYTGSARDIYQEYDGVSPDLSIYVAAKRVLGLDPAWYRFDYSTHSLSKINPLPSPEDEKEMFQGEDYASSAVFLWIAGKLDHACDLEGSFGHRKLLIRAGALANRFLISASALHLEGALIAGIRDPQQSAFFAFKERREVSLISVLLGKPFYAI